MKSKPLLPAEWAPQSAVMLTWPHQNTAWARHLAQTEPVFMAIARAVLRFESVLISCEDPEQAQRLQEQLNQYAETAGVAFRALVLVAPSDDSWARDHGPLTVFTHQGSRLIDFGFNAWGNKFPWDKDNALNNRLLTAGAFDGSTLKSVEFILEGGAIDTDGEGTLLTTSECLLSPSRNPDYSRSAMETLFGQLLGIRRVLWLNHGYLAGDDTDSHIDTLARFCALDHICYVACPDESDEHYGALSAMAEGLREFRQASGEPYRLTPLPWPDAILDEKGQRLPATYANFLIINGAVLLPVYDVPQDAAAIATLQNLFPDREIIAIPCRPLLQQGGSLHCVTMQLPAGVMTK
ncbi:agmatine deiminase family protein [Marinobacter gelidimuriae]|uniref:agmatine deiminase family protein n=1 Tax=Marinobacter gelidimuriae TaxID=2739064 RepID=UPI00036DB494|nr:agmatine deiminase family protein [Marinobacter gelidimuriae]